MEDKQSQNNQKNKEQQKDTRKLDEVYADILEKKEQKEVAKGDRPNTTNYGFMDARDFLEGYHNPEHNLKDAITREKEEKKYQKKVGILTKIGSLFNTTRNDDGEIAKLKKDGSIVKYKMVRRTQSVQVPK